MMEGGKHAPRKRTDRGDKAVKALRSYAPLEVRAALTPREIGILFLRAGAGHTAKPMTYRAVGEAFGIGQERVRVIVNNAVKKLEWYREGLELEQRQVANHARAIDQGVDPDDLPDRINVKASGGALGELRRLIQWEERQMSQCDKG